MGKPITLHSALFVRGPLNELSVIAFDSAPLSDEQKAIQIDKPDYNILIVLLDADNQKGLSIFKKLPRRIDRLNVRVTFHDEDEALHNSIMSLQDNECVAPNHQLVGQHKALASRAYKKTADHVNKMIEHIRTTSGQYWLGNMSSDQTCEWSEDFFRYLMVHVEGCTRHNWPVGDLWL